MSVSLQDSRCRWLDTTVGQADIRAVLYQLADVVAEYMDLGMAVDCGELGKFRPTYGSRQVPVGEKFRATFERVQDNQTCSATKSKENGSGNNYSNA